MWGAPSLSLAMFVSMLAATIASILESVGDYYAAARACVVPAPPSHAINRGIAVEGLGSVLAGLFGAGHGTTSYSGFTALICLTGVTMSQLILVHVIVAVYLLYRLMSSSSCKYEIGVQQ